MTMTEASTSVTPAEEDLPLIISVDDHIMEPQTLWQEQLAPSMRDRGPKVERKKVKVEFVGGHFKLLKDVGDDGIDCDVWYFDDLESPVGLLHAAAGYAPEDQENRPATYDDFRPGTWNQTDRLKDMDLNHVEISINYPNTFPRFAGQGFAERADKELALECLKIYNDWMIDDWCGGAGKGRLIPLTLIPLWDPQLAADEVRRCAAKGSATIAFSENPSKLGFPTFYSGEWDPMFKACEETNTTISMHIGSSSSLPTTSPDAPLALSMALSSQNAQASISDLVFSGTLTRFPDLKFAYAESQAGWIPYHLDRMDSVAGDARAAGVEVASKPSDMVKGSIFTAIFDDTSGLKYRNDVGMEHILFEVDYPHTDGTFPNSRKGIHEAMEIAQMDADECYALLRGNAIKAYGLDRFGITE